MLSDHEMRYYQFKARQVFLLQKENDEWEKFCEKTITKRQDQTLIKKKSTDVGVQVCQTKPQFTVTKNGVKDYRRDLIQKSLKISLQRLKDMHPTKPTISASASLKIKNKGFFLPHDLKQQRITARKSYLASLPKGQNVSTSENKNLHRRHKEVIQGQPPSIQQHKPSCSTKDETEVLKHIEEFKEDNTKIQDKNIENVTDAILDDLLGETALALLRIESKKENHFDRTMIYFNNIVKNIEEERAKMYDKWNLSNLSTKDKPPIATLVKSVEPTSISHQNEEFRNTFRNQNPSTFQKGEHSIKTLEKDTLPKHLGEAEQDSTHKSHSYQRNSPVSEILLQSPLEVETLRVIGYKNISLERKKVENIFNYKKQFGLYLKNISHVESDSFNPWMIANQVAEAIIDDCFHDIAQELNDLPSVILSNLYEQEFFQSM